MPPAPTLFSMTTGWAQRPGHALADDAGRGVGRRAGGEGNDQGQRLVGEIRRQYRYREDWRGEGHSATDTSARRSIEKAAISVPSHYLLPAMLGSPTMRKQQQLRLSAFPNWKDRAPTSARWPASPKWRDAASCRRRRSRWGFAVGGQQEESPRWRSSTASGCSCAPAAAWRRPTIANDILPLIRGLLQAEAHLSDVARAKRDGSRGKCGSAWSRARPTCRSTCSMRSGRRIP